MMAEETSNYILIHCFIFAYGQIMSMYWRAPIKKGGRIPSTQEYTNDVKGQNGKQKS